MQEHKTVAINLDSLCSKCGYFESDSGINNGYGCTNKHNDAKVLFIKHKGEYITFNYDRYEDVILFIAQRLTKRNIVCNRRLRKKFYKSAIKIFDSQSDFNKYGLKTFSKCFSFSCPIASEADFQDLLETENREEFSEIESEEDMPKGWGDDIMIITLEEAKQLVLM
jgi:hypothetical protein